MGPAVANAKLAKGRRLPRQKPFPFLALPSELRIRIYELVLLLPDAVDLDPLNHYNVGQWLRIFLVSRQLYEEAYRVFYGSNTFRIFPIHGKYFRKKPLLARLAPKYRSEITKLNLRLGVGWNGPPKSWAVTPKLGLADLKSVRLLQIYVDFDPAASDIWEGFRVSKSFYSDFCCELLRTIFKDIDSLVDVEFGADTTVKHDGPLMEALLQETRRHQKRVIWSSQRGWVDTRQGKRRRSTLESLSHSLSLIHLGGEVPVES